MTDVCNDLGRVYPLLPDSDGADDFSPHPDGRAWRKACGECAFRTCDPQGLGADYQRDLRHPSRHTVFYCLHRQDEGHERVCACFAALNAPTPTTKEETDK